MTGEPSSSRQVPSQDELARFVDRALQAGSTVAVVELLAPGQPFEPSRGRSGTWYQPDQTSVRDLAEEGSGVLDGGLALYPPPDPGARRVIVLALDDGNWLPYDEALEQRLTELVNDWRANRDR